MPLLIGHALPLWFAASLGGCGSDQGLTPFAFDSVAWVAGDFDAVEQTLSRLGVPATAYEGYIVGPATGTEAIGGDGLTPTVEALLAADEGTLATHDAVFLDSGVRGLGEVVYNGVEPDDAFVADPAVLAAVVAWVESGGVLIASDWAYDLAEQAWPDAVSFAREAEGLDAAQSGLSERILATVEDPALAAALGAEQLAVDFDFRAWAVMQDVGPDTTVHLRGDALYRADQDDVQAELPAAPLLVSFSAGGGRVVLSSFAWWSQAPAVADTLLPALVPGLPLGQAAAP